MREHKNSLLDNVLGWIIGIPIILTLLILFSPVILYFLLVKAPILAFQEKAFLKRNAGKRILCTSAGRKFQVFHSAFRNEILSLGINDIVVFDATKPDNQYDGFAWDAMISRAAGFPILVSIGGKSIFQQPLKNEFMAYFKKEIDWIQLKGCIRRRVDGKSY